VHDQISFWLDVGWKVSVILIACVAVWDGIEKALEKRSKRRLKPASVGSDPPPRRKSVFDRFR